MDFYITFIRFHSNCKLEWAFHGRLLNSLSLIFLIHMSSWYTVNRPWCRRPNDSSSHSILLAHPLLDMSGLHRNECLAFQKWSRSNDRNCLFLSFLLNAVSQLRWKTTNNVERMYLMWSCRWCEKNKKRKYMRGESEYWGGSYWDEMIDGMQLGKPSWLLRNECFVFQT